MNLAGTLPRPFGSVVVVGAIVSATSRASDARSSLLDPCSVAGSSRRDGGPPPFGRSGSRPLCRLARVRGLRSRDGPADRQVLVGLVLNATVVDLVFEGARSAATSAARPVPGGVQHHVDADDRRPQPRTCSGATRDCLHGGPRGRLRARAARSAKRAISTARSASTASRPAARPASGSCPRRPASPRGSPPSERPSLARRPTRRRDPAARRHGGGLVNAVGMTALIVAMIDRMQDATGLERRLLKGGST